MIIAITISVVQTQVRTTDTPSAGPQTWDEVTTIWDDTTQTWDEI
jgi:hypothetical protein